MRSEVFSRHLKKARAETKTLKFWRDIKLKNFAAIRQGRHAVAPVAGIAANRLIEIEHQQAGPPQDRRLPPARPAPRDHAFELPAGNQAPVSVAPGSVMHGGDPFGVAFPGIPYGNDRLDHFVMLRLLGLPPQELFRVFLHLLHGHCTKNTVQRSHKGVIRRWNAGDAISSSDAKASLAMPLGALPRKFTPPLTSLH